MLQEVRTKVAQFQKQCEEYLVVIVQQKREADEQQKVQTSQPARAIHLRRRSIPVLRYRETSGVWVSEQEEGRGLRYPAFLHFMETSDLRVLKLSAVQCSKSTFFSLTIPLGF